MLDADWTVHEVEGAVPDAAGVGSTGQRGDGRTTDGGGVSLVAVVVKNGAPTPRRVRIESVLDGQLLPPRRDGVPEAGWTAGGYCGVVPPQGQVGVGFASGGSPADPPVEVVDEGRVDATGGAGDDSDPSPTDLLRDLGSPAPPRDAVPSAASDGARGHPERDDAAAAPSGDPAGAAPDGRTNRAPTDALPGPVAAWLDDVAGRVREGTDTPGDGAALRAVADRATALAAAREEGEATDGCDRQPP